MLLFTLADDIDAINVEREIPVARDRRESCCWFIEPLLALKDKTTVD